MTDTSKHYTVTHHTWEGADCGWRVAAPSIDALIRFPTEAEAIAAAESHRAAVVADSPELAHVFDLLGRARWELWRASRSPNTIEAIDEAFIAAERDLPSPGPQEPVPAELAQANERIAALEAAEKSVRERWTDSLTDRLAAMAERDAALARVAELEVAMNDGPDGWRKRMQVLAEHDRILLEAAAQPKPRDESVPAPRWRRIDADGVVSYRRVQDEVFSTEATWIEYDAEHGYAPAHAWLLHTSESVEEMLQGARADERARAADAMLVWSESEALTEREKWACQQMARWVRSGSWGEGT